MCEPQPSPITVLVVEDHPVVLDGLRGYLQTAADIQVVGHTSDGQEAVALVQEHVPDVVILDMVLDGSEMNGLETICQLREASPNTQVLVLSAYQDDHLVFPAIQAGAMGYLLKTSPSHDILDAVRAVARRQPVLHPRIYEKLADFLSHASEGLLADSKQPQLTNREWEVLTLVAQNLSNKEIAEALVISEKTVKTHVSNILQKLHLSDRHQAGWWAMQQSADPP